MEVTLALIRSLREKKRDLERQVNDREDIQVERMADPLDISTAQANRDGAAGNINRASGELKEVNAALRRIDNGDYGLCVECEEDIPEKRLAAVPWAARCIPCQEAFDNDVAYHAAGDVKRLSDRKASLFEEIQNREEAQRVR